MGACLEQLEQGSELASLDAHEFLDELKKTYEMKDPHVVHAGASVQAAVKVDDEITLF
jgi:hypothetical protein